MKRKKFPYFQNLEHVIRESDIKQSDRN